VMAVWGWLASIQGDNPLVMAVWGMVGKGSR
jgi:hypothetical protein